jgi:hypothetical protein
VVALAAKWTTKKAPEGGPGLENAMLVVLVRRGATREAYSDRGGGAIAGATELTLRLWLLRLRRLLPCWLPPL